MYFFTCSRFTRQELWIRKKLRSARSISYSFNTRCSWYLDPSARITCVQRSCAIKFTMSSVSTISRPSGTGMESLADTFLFRFREVLLPAGASVFANLKEFSSRVIVVSFSIKTAHRIYRQCSDYPRPCQVRQTVLYKWQL